MTDSERKFEEIQRKRVSSRVVQVEVCGASGSLKGGRDEV
jgi:hypothetical protein